ncbi:MAG: MotA/TolQ/ExbB proton channel family protein [Thermoleophilaceae bacterium]|nr:MotA/TolQ/ExbB proton channel family protein [Thermoleophilaceae bacterium]
MNLIYATSVGDTITNSVADVAEALRYPVLIAAMIALLVVAYELGRLAVETWKRSQLPKTPFEQVSRHAVAQASAGDTAGAQATLKGYTYNDQLQKAAVGTLFAANAIDAQRAVIEYDLYVSKRLDRVRLLVRAGPALGLMGTLIPLSPALAALGKGQPNVLADELQTAFSITVIGVLVGLVAFTIALVRERFYTKDLADLEFLRELRGDAAIITPATVPQPSAAAPSHMTATDQPVAASQVAAEQTLVIPAPQQAAAPPPAAAAPVAPVAPATPPPAAPPAPAQSGAAPPAFPAPAAAPKKKFGLRKKTPKASAAPAFPPPPPPSTTIPPVAPSPGAPTPGAPTPDSPGGDAKGE